MRPTAAVSLLAGLLFSLACSDTPTAPGPRLDELGEVSSDLRRVSVMTQNLYVGTDVDAVLLAILSPDPNDDLPALLVAIETLKKTDFPTRAEAFADAIARERPDVVGFQEVSDVHVDLAAFGIPVIDLQFMPIIEAALAARGLNYQVAAVVKNIVANPVPGVSLVDYDAILVNTDRATIDFAHTQNFSNNLGVVAPGVELKRGLVMVAATIEGRRYYFVNTHLEPDLAGIDLSELRMAQMWELAVAVLGDATPAFVMGDLNDRAGSPMYQVLQQAGFQDVWTELRPGVEGFTNGRSPDLANPENEFTKRIDYIWVRGLDGPPGQVQGRITRLGVLPHERVQGPFYEMWPSDHAGLVAELHILKGPDVPD